jgi:methyl-accepting chemotaxis protein
MEKELAPPPGEGEGKKEVDKFITEQRLSARQSAERRRALRMAERKQSALENLSSAISELNSMSQEASSAVAQLEQTFAEITASAVQTSDAADKSRAAVENISASVDSVKRNTQVSLEKVEAIRSLISATSQSIASLISGVNVTVTTNRRAASLLETLEKQTLDIEATVSGITRASEQINLMALNAAIESSRVGEHGAGFSVVADEIMKLAQQTEESTGQIMDASQNIKGAVNVVSEDLTEIVELAQQDAVRANEIIANLDLTVEEIELLQKNSEGIGNLADSQSLQAAKMLENSDQISENAAQVSAATQQATAALQQQARGLEAIVQSTEDIDKQSETISREKYAERASEELATSAEELSATVQQSEAAAQQVSGAIDQIAQAALQQADAAQNNSSLATVVENSAKEISDRAQNHLDKVAGLQKLLSNLNSESTAMIERISATASSNMESAKKVRALDVELSALGRVMGKLSKINTLTNMIAVAGRIESARAGEHGFGLATVSTDIRGLVEQSADQIAEIEEILRLIQETVTNIATDVDQTGNTVQQGFEKSKAITADLAQVEEDMIEVVAGVKAIQLATGDSLAAIEVTKSNIDSVTQAAEQASVACQQASSAAMQQAQAMRVLANTAAEIAEQADEL